MARRSCPALVINAAVLALVKPASGRSILVDELPFVLWWITFNSAASAYGQRDTADRNATLRGRVFRALLRQSSAWAAYRVFVFPLHCYLLVAVFESCGFSPDGYSVIRWMPALFLLPFSFCGSRKSTNASLVAPSEDGAIKVSRALHIYILTRSYYLRYT